jgi:hypothetical protein
LNLLPKDQNYNALPIGYLSYLRWLDDENNKDDFFIVSTYNYEIYEKELWNSKGREIYNICNLAEHSAKVIAIINAIGAKSFIVQHEYSPSLWLPDFIVQYASKLEGGTDKIFDIRCFLIGVDLSNFDGGFAFEEDFKKFISLFIDYPFLFKYKNIDCISLDFDLIIKITHHLDVQFISKDERLINCIKNDCHVNGLRFNESNQ